jgi:hypothetical protein
MVKVIVVAAFSIKDKSSVLYQKYLTMRGVCNGVTKAIEELDADYISIRIIKGAIHK